MRHSIPSCNQQRRPLPSLLSDSYSYGCHCQSCWNFCLLSLSKYQLLCLNWAPSIYRYFSEEPGYPVVVYHENHVIHPVTERPRPSCGPSHPPSSVIVNSLPASSAAAAARYSEQQLQQQWTSSGGNQSIMHTESQSLSSDNTSSSSSSNGSATVKFSPDFRNQLYESLDAASLAAHGIVGGQPAHPATQQQAFTKMRRSADGLYGGPVQQQQQASPHVADYDRGYENRKTTCLLYLQVIKKRILILVGPKL